MFAADHTDKKKCLLEESFASKKQINVKVTHLISRSLYRLFSMVVASHSGPVLLPVELMH